MLESAKIWW